MPKLRIPTLTEIIARDPWAPGTTQEWAPRLARKIRDWKRHSIDDAYSAMVASVGTEELNGEREFDIRRAVERVYNHQLTGGTSTARTKPLAYDPELLTAQANQLPFAVPPEWLVEHSPVNVANVSPAQFLDAIFHPFELVAVKIRETDLGILYNANIGQSYAEELNAYVRRGQDCGAWFYANPVSGHRTDKGACYADKFLTRYQHLMLESDAAPADLWLRMLVQLTLPILAIYTSAGRSIHSIVRIDAKDKPGFDQTASSLKTKLIPLGLCPGCGKATQATRLPGVMRNEPGKTGMQKLLWLDPLADGQPIYKKETP
jgi:hypothetical protein